MTGIDRAIILHDYVPPRSLGAKARPEAAERKALTKQTTEGAPVHSFRSLLSHLATLAINRIQSADKTARSFDQLTVPTSLQQRALSLLGVPESALGQ